MDIVSRSRNKYLANEKRHEDILKVAFKLFNCKGYKATTTAEIADAAKINEPTLYKHFKNKKKLFLECIDIVFKEMIKVYLPVYEQYRGDEINLIMNLVKVFIDFVKSNPDKSKFLVQLLSYREEPEFRKFSDNFLETNISSIERVIKSARKKGLIQSNLSDHFLAGYIVCQYFCIIAFTETPSLQNVNKNSFIQALLDMLKT